MARYGNVLVKVRIEMIGSGNVVVPFILCRRFTSAMDIRWMILNRLSRDNPEISQYTVYRFFIGHGGPELPLSSTIWGAASQLGNSTLIITIMVTDATCKSGRIGIGGCTGVAQTTNEHGTPQCFGCVSRLPNMRMPNMRMPNMRMPITRLHI
jgi:hypothetical protein